MKKSFFLAITLVLTAVLFTACRENDGNNGMITSKATTAPTTVVTTAPTTAATETTIIPTVPETMIPETNGDTTNTTEETNIMPSSEASRARTRKAY